MAKKKKRPDKKTRNIKYVPLKKSQHNKRSFVSILILSGFLVIFCFPSFNFLKNYFSPNRSIKLSVSTPASSGAQFKKEG